MLIRKYLPCHAQRMLNSKNGESATVVVRTADLLNKCPKIWRFRNMMQLSELGAAVAFLLISILSYNYLDYISFQQKRENFTYCVFVILANLPNISCFAAITSQVCGH